MSVLGDDRIERRERKVPPRVIHSRVTPLEAVPVETVSEGEIGLCTQVIVPDRGVFVVIPAPQIDGELAAQQRYLGLWRDANSAEIYLFSRPVLDEVDLVQSVRNLQRDLDVSVESLTVESETLERRVLATELDVEDATTWQPMTHAFLWELVGFVWTPYEGENSALGQVVAACEAYALGEPTDARCDLGEDNSTHLLEDIIAAICGGCTGSCCGSNDPCCANTSTCCRVTCPSIADCLRWNCSNGACYAIPWPGPCTTDNNPCTNDVCYGFTCTHEPIQCCAGATGSCNDNNSCTLNDHCNNGGGYPNNCPGLPPNSCCGTPRTCPPDGKVCTSDGCTSGMGCNYPNLPNTTYCGSDGNVCTSDYCYWGVCQSPTPNNGNSCASDNKICTADVCSEGTCTHPPTNNGLACESDGNRCTTDKCNASGQCTHPPRCSSGYTCCPETGVCVPLGQSCCGELICPVGQFCCLGAQACCPSGSFCCPDGVSCCPTGTACCNGECVPAELLCLNRDNLTGGTITVSPSVPCVGETLTFHLTGVVDNGGFKFDNCNWVLIPPGTVQCDHFITRPDGVSVYGAGCTGSIVADQPGTYSCYFRTAVPTRECSPWMHPVGPAIVVVTTMSLESATGQPCQTLDLILTASCYAPGSATLTLTPEYPPPYNALVPPWLTLSPPTAIACDGASHTQTINVTISGDAPPGTVPIRVTGTTANGQTCEATGSVTVERTYLPIEVRYKTFIAAKVVETPMHPKIPDYFAGDDRWFEYSGGTSRTFQSTTVSLDPMVVNGGPVGQSNDVFGTTLGYNDALQCPHCSESFGDWCFLPSAILECQRTAAPGVAGDILSTTHSRVGPNEVKVVFRVHGANPCAQGILGPDAPAIDATLTVHFRQLCQNGALSPMEFRLYGTHDGFPWHEVYVNQTRVYEHDACCTHETPSSLFGGTGEHAFEATDYCHQQDPPLNQWRQVPGP